MATIISADGTTLRVVSENICHDSALGHLRISPLTEAYLDSTPICLSCYSYLVLYRTHLLSTVLDRIIPERILVNCYYRLLAAQQHDSHSTSQRGHFLGICLTYEGTNDEEFHLDDCLACVPLPTLPEVEQHLYAPLMKGILTSAKFDEPISITKQDLVTSMTSWSQRCQQKHFIMCDRKPCCYVSKSSLAHSSPL